MITAHDLFRTGIMRSQVEQLGQQIYLIVWAYPLTIDEMVETTRYLDELSLKNGDETYAVVVDLKQVKNIPFEIRKLDSLEKKRLTGIVMLNASFPAQVAGSILEKVSRRVQYKVAHTLEEALEYSRGMLAAAKTTI
jgi:hypothetical protein